MRIDLNVDVKHLTRVEGHGNIYVRIRDGVVEEARWEVVETPRFFEVMLKGKHYTSAGILTARICGICSIGHALASIRTTEAAFGVVVPERARRIRLLAKHGETLQSHSLHLLFLATPDFLGLPSAIPLMTIAPDVFALAGRLKGLANRMSDLFAGRTTHPTSLLVGGVGRMPPLKEMQQIRDELHKSLDDLRVATEIVQKFKIPDFTRETEFVSLKGERDYPWIGGNLLSTDGVDKPEREYLAMTNEYVIDHSTSKWAKLSRESFAVGALARFNNNHRFLHPEAWDVAHAVGLRPVSHNPFHHNLAQLVEMVHVTHESIRLIDELIDLGPGTLAVPVEPRAGEGMGAVEVPRGILYHHYVFDDDGRVEKANCVIPTTQNNANISHDIEELARTYANTSTTNEELSLIAEMLVRAYDPCISCSVH
ncbi:MAG: Ni/Fe hydrogenase subunit alpha [Deltaproteobacteria bacterium]|nr:Ni/Fe hydrogenase subunit alpha [Deltaproteobacteria bacterium]